MFRAESDLDVLWESPVALLCEYTQTCICTYRAGIVGNTRVVNFNTHGKAILVPRWCVGKHVNSCVYDVLHIQLCTQRIPTQYIP